MGNETSPVKWILSSIDSRDGLFSERRTFRLRDSTTEAVHSTFALAELLDNVCKPAHSFQPLFLHPPAGTPDQDQLEQEAEHHGTAVPILQTYRESTSDRWLYLRSLMEITDGSDCVFDLTNLSGALSVTATSYAAFHQGMHHSDLHAEAYVGRTMEDGQTIQFTNVEHLLQLPEWSVSEETLIQNVESDPLSSRLEQLHGDSYREDELPESRRLQQLARMISGTYDHLTSALPMEAGQCGSNRRPAFKEEVQQDLKRLHPIITRLIEEAQNGVDELTPATCPEEKKETPLNVNELRRQLRAITTLSRAGKVLPGFIMAREVLVNGAMLGTKEHLSGNIWLDGEVRADAAAPFYLLNHWMQYDDLRGFLSDRQQRVARVWGSVKQRRNELAHAGFCPDTIRYRRLQNELGEKLEEIRDLVLNNRPLLSSLLNFGFSGHAMFFPVRDGSPEAERLLRFLYRKRSSVTEVFLFQAGHASEESLEACRERLKKAGVSYQTLRVPPGKAGFEYGENLWDEHRSVFLANKLVSAVITGSSPALDHLVRQMFQRICQFGIPADLLAVQECPSSGEGSQSEMERVMIDQFDPSLKARSR